MTPAIDLAKRQKIQHRVHQYDHDAAASSYGQEAADKLNIDAARVFKTLVVETDQGKLAVGIVPVSGSLNLKQLAKALKTKRVAMADAQKVARSSGYVLGGVSPLAQKKSLPTVLDASAEQFPTIFVSAGRRGLEIELAASDLLQLTRGLVAAIAS